MKKIKLKDTPEKCNGGKPPKGFGWRDELSDVSLEDWEAAKSNFPENKSFIEKMKSYQYMYEAISRKLEAEIQKEYDKRGGDTNTYLPKEWKEKE